MRRTAIKRKPPRNGPGPEVVREKVMYRLGGRCEAQLAGICTRLAEEFHHRQSRSASRNPHTVGNGAALCRACHHHITHVSPRAGREVGLIVSRHFNGDPGTVPMLVPGYGWAYLTPMGTYIPAQPPEVTEP